MDELLAQSLADADATQAKMLREHPPPPRYDVEMQTAQSGNQQEQQQIQASLAAKLNQAGVCY
jgi:hypothetical protein